MPSSTINLRLWGSSWHCASEEAPGRQLYTHFQGIMSDKSVFPCKTKKDAHWISQWNICLQKFSHFLFCQGINFGFVESFGGRELSHSTSSCRELCSGMPIYTQSWTSELGWALVLWLHRNICNRKEVNNWFLRLPSGQWDSEKKSQSSYLEGSSQMMTSWFGRSRLWFSPWPRSKQAALTITQVGVNVGVGNQSMALGKNEQPHAHYKKGPGTWQKIEVSSKTKPGT